jgi:hypothetical protein
VGNRRHPLRSPARIGSVHANFAYDFRVLTLEEIGTD